jgi:hypothetical protein
MHKISMALLLNKQYSLDVRIQTQGSECMLVVMILIMSLLNYSIKSFSSTMVMVRMRSMLVTWT